MRAYVEGGVVEVKLCISSEAASNVVEDAAVAGISEVDAVDGSHS